MFKKVLLIFLLAISSFECYKVNKNSSAAVSRVIDDLVDAIYVNKSQQFDVLIYGALSSHLNEIIKGSNYGMFKTELKHMKNTSPPIFNGSSLIFMNKFSDLITLNSSFQLMNKFPARLRFLIYCEEVKSQKDLEKLPLAPLDFEADQYGGNIQHFSYFIVNSKSSVKVSTIDLFSSKNLCNVPFL